MPEHLVIPGQTRIAEPVAGLAALRSALQQLEDLSSADLPRSKFWQKLLDVLGATGAVAGSVWWIDPDKTLNRLAEYHLERLHLSTNLSATRRHQVLLTGAFQSEGPTKHSLPQLPPPTDTIIFIPVSVQGRHVGVVDLFVQGKHFLGESDQESQSLLVLLEVGGLINRYLDRMNESGTAADPARTFELLGPFLEDLHSAATGNDVALVAVNRLRTLLNADRVSLLERRGRQYRLTAISGQATLDIRSNPLRALCALVQGVSSSTEPFVFSGNVLDQPGPVRPLLENYLETSQSRMVMIRPLTEKSVSILENRSNAGSKPNRQRVPAAVNAVLVYEQFSDSRPRPALLRHVEPMSQQVGLALRNARRYERLLIVPGLRVAGDVWNWLTGRRLTWTFVCLGLAALIVTAMCQVQGDYHVEGRGRLMPVGQRHIFAPWEGEIVECLVQGGEQVQPGDVLFRVESPELRSQLLLAESQLTEKRKLLAALEIEQHVAASRVQRDMSLRLQSQLETTKVEIESLQAHIQLLQQQVASLIVRAPVSGTATLLNATDQLLGRPVHRGEHMLDVMDESGSWRLEIALPEQHTLAVMQFWQMGTQPEVQFRLLASPTDVYRAPLSDVDDQTRPTSHGDSVLHVFAELDEAQLPQPRIGADLVARIDCGRRSLLEIYFGDTMDFIRRKLWI